MSRIRSRDTAPELAVRSVLHHAGFRYRLHDRRLPGTPDIVLPRHRLAIFVHGCFWHGHTDCSRAATPATRTEFWTAKIAGNAKRDQAAAAALDQLGWRTLTIWGCEVQDGAAIAGRLSEALDMRGRPIRNPSRADRARTRQASGSRRSRRKIAVAPTP